MRKRTEVDCVTTASGVNYSTLQPQTSRNIASAGCKEKCSFLYIFSQYCPVITSMTVERTRNLSVERWTL